MKVHTPVFRVPVASTSTQSEGYRKNVISRLFSKDRCFLEVLCILFVRNPQQAYLHMINENAKLFKYIYYHLQNAPSNTLTKPSHLTPQQ